MLYNNLVPRLSHLAKDSLVTIAHAARSYDVPCGMANHSKARIIMTSRWRRRSKLSVLAKMAVSVPRLNALLPRTIIDRPIAEVVQRLMQRDWRSNIRVYHMPVIRLSVQFPELIYSADPRNRSVSFVLSFARSAWQSRDDTRRALPFCQFTRKGCKASATVKAISKDVLVWDRSREMTKIDFLSGSFSCLPRTWRYVCEYYSEALSGITLSAGLFSSLIAYLPTPC